MQLHKTWSPYFRSPARLRGKRCHEAGGVKRLNPQPGELIRAAVAIDSAASEVSFRHEGAGTTAACDCDDFGGGFYCSCIWATLLAIEQEDGPFAGGVTVKDFANPTPPRARKRHESSQASRSTEPAWQTRLDLIRSPRVGGGGDTKGLALPIEICYFVCPKRSVRHERLVIELSYRHPTSKGYSRLKRFKVSPQLLGEITDPVDRELCALLLGGGSAQAAEDEDVAPYMMNRSVSTFVLPDASGRGLLERMIQAGRCFLKTDGVSDEDAPASLRWDGGDPWVLWLTGGMQEEELVVALELRRDGQTLPINGPDLVLGGPAGFVINQGVVAAFDDRGAYPWVSQFRDQTWEDNNGDGQPQIRVLKPDAGRFLERLVRLEALPKVDLPDGLGLVEEHAKPTPHLELSYEPRKPGGRRTEAASSRPSVTARVWFEYGQSRVDPWQLGNSVTLMPEATQSEDIAASTPGEGGADTAVSLEAARHTLAHRDKRYEAEMLALLWSLGFRRNPSEGRSLLLRDSHIPDAVGRLLDLGWSVTADQTPVHLAQAPRLSVASGIDWFELRGSVSYQTQGGDRSFTLPEILQAVRSGKTMIPLGDGTQGMLPHEWLREQGLLVSIGRVEKDYLKFKPTQAVILDSLLRRQPAVEVDDRFRVIRERLREFQSVTEADPGPAFHGKLRSYQREGLGWLDWLGSLRLGGILADDMGLGKTVQVLGLLDRYYNAADNGDAPQQSQAGDTQATETDNGKPLPSLIVVPRSIVFNWIDEAERFAPKLRVQGYTGTERHGLRADFADQHVIVTSYGLMRRDIAALSEHRFAYAVLDEAQAIKNPGSQSAQAARLLRAEHRLALTGTPVENHLGDLWSIFEFLNPGMLGNNSRFAKLVRSAKGRQRVTRPPVVAVAGVPVAKADDEAPPAGVDQAAGTKAVVRALGPFILRRTKGQVLKELPEKTEQTILCQMEPPQRKIYDDLLAHYRGTLLAKREGATPPGGSAMQVLEALLRLRQAACHPGLIDAERASQPSAKLDVLMDRLVDLIEEGHKTLVFSQFTSMLSIVRQRLDQRGIIYEYLDGQTRNRKQCVERFQNDPHCQLFLISLKAGGLGLNLTAAGYVFILDPWWNPAVEAQAIDRAHRIGQTQHVFAYRLICEDTVEQRIAELQHRKRKLAETIVAGQENLLSSLTKDELEYLLT